MMLPVETQLATLTAEVQAMVRRHDDTARVSAERHEENLDRFEGVRSDLRDVKVELRDATEEVRKTNGTVQRHEEQIKSLERHVFGRESRQAKPKPDGAPDIENLPLNLKSVKAIIGYIAAALLAGHYVMTQLAGYHK